MLSKRIHGLALVICLLSLAFLTYPAQAAELQLASGLNLVAVPCGYTGTVEEFRALLDASFVYSPGSLASGAGSGPVLAVALA